MSAAVSSSPPTAWTCPPWWTVPLSHEPQHIPYFKLLFNQVFHTSDKRQTLQNSTNCTWDLKIIALMSLTMWGIQFLCLFIPFNLYYLFLVSWHWVVDRSGPLENVTLVYKVQLFCFLMKGSCSASLDGYCKHFESFYSLCLAFNIQPTIKPLCHLHSTHLNTSIQYS